MFSCACLLDFWHPVLSLGTEERQERSWRTVDGPFKRPRPETSRDDTDADGFQHSSSGASPGAGGETDEFKGSGPVFQTLSCVDVRVRSHHSGIAEEAEDSGEDWGWLVSTPF